MPRILLDANMPVGLRAILPDHEVVTAFDMGWGALTNGELLAAAEAAGFDAMITGDQNISYQQNLSSRTLALVVVETNHLPTLQDNAKQIELATKTATKGSYQAVAFDRVPLRRRPYPPRTTN